MENTRYIFFFSPPYLKEPANEPWLRNLVMLTHITKHREPTQHTSKTIYITQGETIPPHTSWTLQEYKDYFIF